MRKNPTPDAQLEPMKSLVDELAVILQARATSDDVAVPTVYNENYLYQRRFLQGSRYPLIVRWKDLSWKLQRRGCARPHRSLYAASRINFSLVHGSLARITSALPGGSI